MPNSKTVTTKSQHTIGPGVVLSHAAIAPIPGGYALYDCTDPGQTGAHNCIWPYGAAGGPVTFTRGLVVVARDPSQSGSVSVTTA